MEHDLPLYIGFVVMSLSSLALYAHGVKTGEYKHHTFIHAVVPFVAATSYLAMANDFGFVELVSPDGDPNKVFYARYLDWSVTTPLLLTGLVLTALHEHARTTGYMIAVLVLDVMMVLAGLAAALATEPGVVLAFYLWSCAAFAGVLYLLWKTVMAVSKSFGGAMHGAYKRNLSIVTALWLIYPVVFAVGPEGLSWFGDAFSVWAILILDISAKVVYGFVSASKFKELARDSKAERIREGATA